MASRFSYTLVDEPYQAASVIRRIKASRRICVDCEGVKLSRLGELSILQVCTEEPKEIYIFDVQKLGSWLFDAGMRSILESQNIIKLMYDCRNDSDALEHNHDVHLQGVRDLQLLAYILMPSQQRFVMGLGKALQKYVAGYSSGAVKDRVKEIFQVKPDVWKARPIDKLLLDYCAADVAYFFDLLTYFQTRIAPYEASVTMKRWEVESENYAEVKRSLATVTHSKYESNPRLPLRIIPDIFSGSLVPFSKAGTTCFSCKRAFAQQEIFASKCLVCRMIDDNDRL